MMSGETRITERNINCINFNFAAAYKFFNNRKEE